MDLGLGLDDFLKNLKDKQSQNPPIQSQAAKRKQKRILNSNYIPMGAFSQKQESNIQKSDSILSLQEISAQAMSQPVGNSESGMIRLPSLGELQKTEKTRDTMVVNNV